LKFEAEYASEVLDIIPFGYINKKVCGVGLTSVALENDVHTIVAVPSVELIRNKVAQYPNDRSQKTVFGVYGGVSVEDVNDYVASTDVIKIMCTYDSLWKVQYLLDSCHLIIDESNKLLSSSALKSSSKGSSKGVDVTTRVFDIAEKFKDTVTFISATPTPLEYMPKWVSEIEQIDMEWGNTIKAKPILVERTYPYKALVVEVLRPLNMMDSITMGNVEIKKVIVFMNSVESIVKSINEAQLKKEDVAIIAGDSVENDVKIKGYNRLSNPNKLPKYTFVTSSGFEGIDLSDKEAISIVVSNTSKSYQMIDILTDLKQAISRQRDKKNPNYDKFVYIYSQSIFSKSKEELLKELDDRYESLSQAIYLWEVAKRDGKRSGFSYTETNKDFITYTNYDEVNETYTLNTNLFQSDKYFILTVREQYSKGFDLKGGYTEYDVIESPEVIAAITYEEMVEMYKSNKESIEDYSYKVEYYSNEYKRVFLTVRNRFIEGEQYSVAEVKDKLQVVYKEFGLSRKAKSTDLQEFMVVKETKSNGNRFVTVVTKDKTIK